MHLLLISMVILELDPEAGGELHTEVSVQISFFHLPNKIYLIKYLESVRRSNLTANVLSGFA